MQLARVVCTVYYYDFLFLLTDFFIHGTLKIDYLFRYYALSSKEIGNEKSGKYIYISSRLSTYTFNTENGKFRSIIFV